MLRVRLLRLTIVPIRTLWYLGILLEKVFANNDHLRYVIYDYTSRFDPGL